MEVKEYTNIAGPRYQQVAADIAAKIVDRQYLVGERIYARSLIASQYAVSAETARRAIAILSDMDIVETTKGSGVVITSYENALLFVNRYHNTSTLAELKRAVQTQTDQLSNDCLNLKEAIAQLVDRTDQFRFTNPFIPYDTTVEADSACIGRSLSDLNFWHNTAATIIAVRRGPNLTLSPGPYEVLLENDVLYFVGKEKCLERVIGFLREPSSKYHAETEETP